MGAGKTKDYPSNVVVMKPVPWWRHRGVVEKIVVLLAVVIVAAGLLVWKNTRPTGPKVSSVCTGTSNGLIKQAQQAFLASDNTKIAQAVSAIKQHKNYQNDPNCDYEIIIYDLTMSKVTAAQNDYNNLLKVYDPKVGFSSQVGGSAITPQLIQSNIAAMQKASQSNASQFSTQ